MIELIRTLISLTRPGSLIIAILMFSLGTGIADFLGAPLDWLAYWIGLACGLLLLVSSQLLDLFFKPDQHFLAISLPESLKQATPALTVQSFRRLILQIAVTVLTVGAALTVLMLSQRIINIPAFLILGISFVLSFINAVPPFSLSQKGIGEVIEAILIVNFLSALGLLLQFGEIHRLLIMLTIPLTCLLLSMRLALALPRYGEDMQKKNDNMMIDLGWERGMLIHNYLVLTAYALIALASIFGLPWRLVWPGLLTLPIGLYQILQMRQIATGIKPQWNILRLTSITLFGLTTYLITLSLWIG